MDVPKASQAARDDACELGQWLLAAGERYASLPSFGQVKTSHTGFHIRAGEVVSLLERGDREQAEQMLEKEGAFTVASEAVILALTMLRAEASRAEGEGGKV